jgi:CheY-like chemotaxis protein
MIGHGLPSSMAGDSESASAGLRGSFAHSEEIMASRVLFLDDDSDLREIVTELTGSLGIECDAVASVAEMQSAAGLLEGKFYLAILDINLGDGRPSGIDAYRWLRAQGFVGRVAFLTGHARSHPLVAEALRAGDVTVYDKPITVAGFRAILA